MPVRGGARSRVGDWEDDTVAGRAGGSCRVPMVDRMSGYFAGGKTQSKRKNPIRETMDSAMAGRPVETVELDHGKEFAEHGMFTEAIGAARRFCLPHHPWQRVSSENASGLPRQYFPKGCDLGAVADEEIAAAYDELNRRPRERLGWRTPYEVYRSLALRLL